MDRQHNLGDMIEQARQAFQGGDRERAIGLLATVVRSEPNNEEGWKLLAEVVEEPDRKLYCLQQVVRINPQNREAHWQLVQLQSPPIPRDEPRPEREPARPSRPPQQTKSVSYSVPSQKPRSSSNRLILILALAGGLLLLCCLCVSIRPQLGLWTPSGTVIPINVGEIGTPHPSVEQERGIPNSFSEPLEQFINSGQVQSYPPNGAAYLQGIDSILLKTYSIMQKVDDLVSRDKAGGMSIEQFNEERIDLQVAFITGPAQDVQALVPPSELRSMHKELIAALDDFQGSIAFLRAQDVPTLEEQGYVVIVGAVDSATYFQQGLGKLTSVWAVREDYLAGRTISTTAPSDRDESVQAILEALRIREEDLPPDTYVLRPGEFVDNRAAVEQSEKNNGEQAIATRFEQLQRWGRILGYNEAFAVPSSTPGNVLLVQDFISLYQTEDGARESFADALNKGIAGFNSIDSTNYPQLGDERLLLAQSSEEVESIAIRFRRSKFFVSVVASASPQDLSLEQAVAWAQLIDQRIQALDPVQLNDALEK